MANYNKVLLIGNLTRDPQLSYTPSQTAVVDFGLATNRRWKAQDGSQREETCFVDCRSFGKQAETINKYLTKGRSVFVEGHLIPTPHLAPTETALIESHPITLNPGSYTVTVIADAFFEISESNENNNEYLFPFLI